MRIQTLMMVQTMKIFTEVSLIVTITLFDVSVFRSITHTIRTKWTHLSLTVSQCVSVCACSSGSQL